MTDGIHPIIHPIKPDECDGHLWFFASDIPVVDTLPEIWTYRCMKCGTTEQRLHAE